MSATLHSTEGEREARTFNEATIQATRQWYADNALACIAEVRSGAVRVNDPEGYFLECRQRHADALAGKWDHTWAFRQQAHFIQTGESVPLLPPAPNQGEPS
jgi:hypothetical protein